MRRSTSPTTFKAAPATRTAVPGQPVAEQAAEALRLATVNPKLAERLARRAEAEARKRQDWASLSVARRARGVASMQLPRLDAAVDQLRGAIWAADQSGDRRLAGEARMSLASALLLRGAPAEGFEAIREALTRLTGPAAARARTQRAAMLLELGRLDDALDDLRLALPVLRRAGDSAWEVRALSNRCGILLARRQFSAAEADLRRAQQICDAHSLSLQGAYVEQNLGCVLADRGDVPSALQQFDRAATRYAELGVEMGSLTVDRAKLLLSVRLVSEARVAAERAVQIYTDQHRKVHLPEAQLILSTAALLQGDHATAAAAAGQAARAFVRLGRAEWLTLARYALVQARVDAAVAEADRSDSAQAHRRGVLIARLRQSATALEEAGWTVPALDARIQASQLALQSGKVRLAREELLLAARARRSGPAEVRTRAWLAEALLRDSEGSSRGARSALRAGLRVVEDYRAAIGATELRATVSIHRGRLARAGLRIALREAKARDVHWWAERGRATANEPRPARPPADQALAHMLQDLRATMAELEGARTSGSDTAALVARQVDLEERIRQRSHQSADSVGVRASAPPTVEELAEHLAETAYVEYVNLERTLHAVTVVDGRARLHTLGDETELRHWLDHLSFALRRLAAPRARAEQIQAAEAVISRAAATIGESLITPLLPVLGDRSLVIVPDPRLQSVPWSVVPACAGRAVSVAPSAALWSAAARRARRRGARMVAIAGPGLHAAREEVDAVAGWYPAPVVLTGTAATADVVARSMDGAGVAHVAAHGTVRADNPLFSSLLLADGPYTVYDLERLRRTPHQVVLAACNAAVSQVTAGVEILGLSAALLNQETATLVAPVLPIPDAETVALMTSYHQRLRLGQSPAEALAAAQLQHRDDSPRTRASAAAFVCLGAGHRPLTDLSGRPAANLPSCQVLTTS